MKWIQWQTAESMSDDALRDYLRESHRLAAARTDEGGCGWNSGWLSAAPGKASPRSMGTAPPPTRERTPSSARAR